MNKNYKKDLMVITEEQIEANRQRIIRLLQSVKREGIDSLICKLDSDDFFTAPASTKYHAHYIGGLAQHSLNVYDNLVALVHLKGLENVISEESCIIVGLLHDLSKMNFYEPTSNNTKVYSENGKNYDDIGRFNWVATLGWKVINQDDRFVYGNHESTSEWMARYFIKLEYPESIAIMHHHGGVGGDSIPSTGNNVISSVYNRYPLALLLHLADMMAAYYDESSIEWMASNNESKNTETVEQM